uniref:Ig-like domain-containing protein n=1 Tax=Falco tinnunculus TaxID=100819 RepID=A0A8C4ULL4_FALTI
RVCYPDVVPCEDITETDAEAPEFLETLPSETTVKEGDDVLLSCVMKGVPTPCVVWLCNQLIVIRTESEEHTHHASLEVRDVREHDAGSYRVFAINSEGSAESTASLLVAHSREQQGLGFEEEEEE